jgi:hypothetical protein
VFVDRASVLVEATWLVLRISQTKCLVDLLVSPESLPGFSQCLIVEKQWIHLKCLDHVRNLLRCKLANCAFQFHKTIIIFQGYS